ncbi:MAG: His/Gly/Thr/Pro-type tRNA ligase C-terminal domain-containing protein, partial [Dehalococcoidia bacterium]
KSLKAQLRQAGTLGIPYVLILGQQELQKGVAVLRDMAKGQQREIPKDKIVDELHNLGL